MIFSPLGTSSLQALNSILMAEAVSSRDPEPHMSLKSFIFSFRRARIWSSFLWSMAERRTEGGEENTQAIFLKTGTLFSYNYVWNSTPFIKQVNLKKKLPLLFFSSPLISFALDSSNFLSSSVSLGMPSSSSFSLWERNQFIKLQSRLAQFL